VSLAEPRGTRSMPRPAPRATAGWGFFSKPQESGGTAICPPCRCARPCARVNTPASKWQTALALNAVGFSANSDLQDQTREAGSESMCQRAIKGPQRATFAERTTRAQRRFDRFSVSIARGHPDRFRVQGMPPLSGVSGPRKMRHSAHLPRERRLLFLCLLSGECGATNLRGGCVRLIDAGLCLAPEMGALSLPARHGPIRRPGCVPLMDRRARLLVNDYEIATDPALPEVARSPLPIRAGSPLSPRLSRRRP
jgi:hypothetical protein